MKYKVVLNQTIMASDVSAAKAMNIICGIMQTYIGQETYDVKVYYLTKNDEWKLENGFKVVAKQLVS